MIRIFIKMRNINIILHDGYTILEANLLDKKQQHKNKQTAILPNTSVKLL